MIEALLPSRGGQPCLAPAPARHGKRMGMAGAGGATPPVKSGLFARHAGVIASVREALILRWGVLAGVPGGGARAAGVAERIRWPRSPPRGQRCGPGRGIVTREDERKGGSSPLLRDLVSGRPGWPGSSGPLRAVRAARPLPHGTAGLAAREVIVHTAGRIWSLIAVQAALRGGHVSAADACAAAVATVAVTGGWLSAAAGTEAGHLMKATDEVSEQAGRALS